MTTRIEERKGFRIRTSGSTDRPTVAEYDCPAHGRFSLEVARDESGDAPSSVACPRDLCGCDSTWCVSAPRVAVRRVEVERGGWQKPERKTWLDTRNLGEGQDIDDFRADRERIRDDERRRGLKELLDG